MQWRDVRLKHSFSPYVLIKEKNITEQIWRPDPYFVNEKHAELFGVTYPNMRMSVYPDGLVNYVIRLVISLRCNCMLHFDATMLMIQNTFAVCGSDAVQLMPYLI